MKGDFSRIRFNPRRQYTAVLQQQGRVSLDADSNEQAAIDDYLSRHETVDVIGAFGAPGHDAGFAISVSGRGILIGAGRYYVQGLVCENGVDPLSYLGQPYPPIATPADSTLLEELSQAREDSSIQVYLQVWQRLVTALDDPCLREPALGQTDTTARLQTVWRVVANLVAPPAAPPPGEVTSDLPGLRNLAGLIEANVNRVRLAPLPFFPAPTPGAAKEPAAKIDCCTAMYDASTSLTSTGTMSATTAAAGSDCSCEPIPSAGYQGIENQLYRIEIHHGGNAATATFKWSRENASVVSSIVSFAGNTIVVDSLGPDANLGFPKNGWVEISDDSDLFGEIPNSPGLLYQIRDTDPTVPSITLANPVIGIDAGRNARVRRWDQAGPAATTAGVHLSTAAPFALENGIQVSFRPGTYQSGDFWTIPARTASGHLDWPPCGSATPAELFQPPQSTLIYNAPLACIHWDPKQQKSIVEDCRRFFLPLTELSAPSLSKALHVTATSWSNDSMMTADVWVAKGLTITLDGAPTSPISSGNFLVTLESIFDPFPQGSLRITGSYDSTAQRLHSTYLRTVFELDSTITVQGPTISWTLPYLNAPESQIFTINLIDAGLVFGGLLGKYGRVRVRLLGNTISSGTGKGQLFLDGRCLGQPAVAANGLRSIELQLPSGAGEPTSDFESWFYVAPTLLIASVTVAFPALFVIGPNGVFEGVADRPVDGPTASVNPFATVTVNYRALADAEITLTLLDSNGQPSQFGNIESPVTIHPGQISTNAAITIARNTPQTNGQFATETITVHASIVTAIGSIAASPVTFTLAGGSFQVIN